MKIQHHRIDTNVVVGLLVREFRCSGIDVSAKVLAMYAGTRTPPMEPQWLAAGLSQHIIAPDNIKEVFLDENTNWRNFAAGDGCLYEVRNEWHAGRCTVERVNFEDAELANLQGISPQKEIVCVIEGLGYASIEKVEGNLLHFSCGPKGGDWNSPEGNMNDVSFAIDLEKGIVYVLGAGWYS